MYPCTIASVANPSCAVADKKKSEAIASANTAPIAIVSELSVSAIRECTILIASGEKHRDGGVTTMTPVPHSLTPFPQPHSNLSDFFPSSLSSFGLLQAYWQILAYPWPLTICLYQHRDSFYGIKDGVI
jgi:hypothetical protein